MHLSRCKLWKPWKPWTVKRLVTCLVGKETVWSCDGLSSFCHVCHVLALVLVLLQEASSNRCHACSNKCLTSSNKKLLELNSLPFIPFNLFGTISARGNQFSCVHCRHPAELSIPATPRVTPCGAAGIIGISPGRACFTESRTANIYSKDATRGSWPY